MKKKQIRKCIITGTRHNKFDLIRIVSFKGKNIEVDLTGKKEGRGCYIYPDIVNVEKLVAKRNVISKVLRKNITNNEIEYLKNELIKAIKRKTQFN